MGRIWIDADAAPRLMKDIVFRASERRKIHVTLVANRWQRTPNSALVDLVVVDDGFDAADDHIAEHCEKGDVVITADVPLAARIVAKDVPAISPRGRTFDADNIAERLGTRNLMEELRSADLVSGGAPPFGDKDRQRFANALDRALQRMTLSG
jgi:uncharacterized protein YaiI (UPF0178 family)